MHVCLTCLALTLRTLKPEHVGGLGLDCACIAEAVSDLLAVCVSLRRDSWRSALPPGPAPAREPEGTSGPWRVSGGVPHIQSTHPDPVAPQEMTPGDPETGHRPGTHLSEVSVHVGKVASVPLSDAEERTAEDMAVCGRDWRLAQKLPNSAVGPGDNSVYVSKMDLGPLAPAGRCLPPSLQKQAAVEAEERGPQAATCLPGCPPSSGIDGVADVHPSLLRAWPNDRGALDQRPRRAGLSLPPPGPGSPSCSEPDLMMSSYPQFSTIPGLPSVEHASRSDRHVWDTSSLWRKPSEPEELFESLMKDRADAHSNMVQVMLAMVPTCPRQARLPGFPSVGSLKVFSRPSMAGLLPTCPTQTTVTGMPFRVTVGLSLDSWNVLQKWTILKPPRRNSLLLDEYLCRFCPWKTGGSSKAPPLPPHQSPRMVDFVPACPRRSRVLGLPSKEFISCQNKNVDLSLTEEGWNQGKDLVRGIPDTDRREIASMIAMLPSCPVRTCLLGMPACPQKALSHTGRVSVCRTGAQRPGTGSQVMSRVRDYRDFRQVSKRPDETTLFVIQPLTWEDSENLRDMVDMSSSCPEKATVFGLPSAPPREARMVDLLPSCPEHTQVCGLPSKVAQTPGAFKNWLDTTKTLWGSPFIQRGVQLHNAGSSLDKSAFQAMTMERPSCPLVSCVPGLPSALALTDGPKMVKLSQGFTGESRVPGMSLGPHTSQVKWTLEGKTLFLPEEKSRFYSLEVFYHHGDVSINTMLWPKGLSPVQKPDHSQTGRGTVMVSMLPSCPNRSNLTGIPSRKPPYLPGGQVWPGRETLGGMPRTQEVGRERDEFVNRLLPQRDNLCRRTPVPEGSVNLPEMSVQVDRDCPGRTSAEISRKAEELAGKETPSQKTETRFWRSGQKEDAAAVGRG